MDAAAGSLITTFDYVWARLTGRLSGLTDEEYFWEPVAGCWSLRQDGQGRWSLDGGGGGGPAPDPVPVTTIAWRLGHLGGMAVGGFANRRFGDGTLTVARIGFSPGAAGVPGFLDEHYQSWRAGLAGLSPGEWTAPLGPSWGPFAQANTVDLALHVLDEVIHHGAEVGLLRDLYSHRDGGPLADQPRAGTAEAPGACLVPNARVDPAAGGRERGGVRLRCSEAADTWRNPPQPLQADDHPGVRKVQAPSGESAAAAPIQRARRPLSRGIFGVGDQDGARGADRVRHIIVGVEQAKPAQPGL